MTAAELHQTLGVTSMVSPELPSEGPQRVLDGAMEQTPSLGDPPTGRRLFWPHVFDAELFAPFQFVISSLQH